jgi:outer membrane protein insertion porin family
VAEVRPVRGLIGVLVLLVTAVMAAPDARAQAGGDSADGLPILDVIFEGNVRVDHRLLRANMRTRTGTLFDRSFLDADIRMLSDQFGVLVTPDDVIVEQVTGGVVVTFSPKIIRRYESVEFEGNDRFSAKVLRGVAFLAEGRVTPAEDLTKAMSLVVDHYLSKGHPFVQVDLKFRRRENGDPDAILRIFEGPEVEVAELRIRGLTALDKGDAADLLRTKPGFWSWLVGKSYVRSEVESDILVLEDYVRREGYLDARVSLDQLQWNKDRTEVVVTLLVDEGPRYTVRSMKVTGNTHLTAEELLDGASIGPGDPYRRPAVGRTLRLMRDLYGRVGFIDIEVQPRETFDLEQPVLDLEWRIQEGQEKKVRDVIVRGNVATRDSVVRRYMTVYPGDVVDTRELRYSEDALISLGYFTDQAGSPRVRVSTEQTDDPEYVDVVVDVDDSSSGVFTFVLGAGSNDGVFGGVTVDKRNFDISRASSSLGSFFKEFFQRGEAFHGGGQRLFLEVVPGTQTTTVDIVFQEPWLDESREDPWGLTVELYDRNRQFSEYTQSTTGLGVLFDHRFNRELTMSVGPRLETVRITDIGDDDADFVTGEKTEFGKAEGSHSRHVIEASLGYSDVDSLFEPTNGVISRVKVEQVGGPLGGDTDVIRTQWTNEWFLPAGEDDEGNINVLRPRFSLGVVNATSKSDELPFYENFFVGGGSGPFSVRGFDFQGVGPHQELKSSQLGSSLSETGGNAVGGRLAAVASIEYQTPLVTQYNTFRDKDETLVKGVLFFDVGNLVPNTAFYDLFSNVRVSTGAGVRLRLPALGGITIQLDYAQVLAEQDEDETRALSFELSRRF